MNQLLQLRQDKAALIADAQAIHEKAITEKRAKTPEEQTLFDSKLAAAKALVKTIEETESLAALSGNAYDERGNRRVEVHDNALDRPFGPEARAGETVEQRKARCAVGFGEQLLAAMTAEKSQGRIVDPRLLEIQKRGPSGASEAVPADGSFLVYPEFSSEIFKIQHDVGLVYPRCKKLQLTTSNAIKIPGVDEQSRVDGSRWGGVQMFWQNEADSTTSKKPKFRLIELNLKKLMGLFYATDELLNDAAVLGSIVMQAFGEEMAFKMDDGVLNGDGSGKPLGILNAANNALVTVNKETGQATGTVVFENIKKMWGRMWGRSRPNAVWFINQDIEQQLYGLVQTAGTGGIPVYLPANGVSSVFAGAAGTPYGTLFGRPVVPIEQANTLSSAGDIILADMSQYVIADRGDMQAAQSMHVKFITDEMTFRWVYRVDGQPLWHTALTPFKGNNTLSPFITLQAR